MATSFHAARETVGDLTPIYAVDASSRPVSILRNLTAEEEAPPPLPPPRFGGVEEPLPPFHPGSSYRGDHRDSAGSFDSFAMGGFKSEGRHTRLKGHKDEGYHSFSSTLSRYNKNPVTSRAALGVLALRTS